MLEQLIHNGVIVPESPRCVGLVLKVDGREVALTPKQEEMALAWARKLGTPYVKDRTFARNFMTDFCQALGLERVLGVEDVDFGPAQRLVQAEREAKECLSLEQRKAQAAERKALREKLKERFGHAIVDGERVELANYITEPSGIFMGRGKHPLRGRWKEGARRQDITLNLSPDAPRPEGEWAEIVWQPDSLWVARWRDKLSDKLKYVWLHDSAPIKQAREASKFDKVYELEDQLDTVRARIQQDLCQNGESDRWRIATACYLIDALCLRVGDEKDPDEADTVGATTLRPEHVTLHEDGLAEFRFLGKDSILWHKKLEVPEVVRENLAELIRTAKPASNSGNGDRSHPTRDEPQLFPDFSSRHVNAYLSEVLPGLTAKVFRTHHATMAVQDCLQESGVAAEDPEHRKWEVANLANLEAAILCNHTKQEPATWDRSRKRYRERQETSRERVNKYRAQVRAHREALIALRAEARQQEEEAGPESAKKVRARYEKKLEAARRRAAASEAQLEKAQLALGKIKVQAAIAAKKRTWNLVTSLKSYIDPRVYYEWGRAVEYDVLERYYPTALRRKFAWVRGETEEEEESEA